MYVISICCLHFQCLIIIVSVIMMYSGMYEFIEYFDILIQLILWFYVSLDGIDGMRINEMKLKCYHPLR